MNLQRREEIKAIAEFPNDRHWAQEMRRAVAELLAHIDTLEQTAAERVIDSGRIEAAEALAERLSKTIERMALGIKPGSAERCAARWVTSSATDRGSFERGWEAREAEGIEVAIGASPTPDYTGEGSAWVPPAEVLAVVVPEIMLSDISDECSAMLCDDREAFRRGALWAQKFITSRARAIPADRVLGGEMVALRLFAERCAQRDHQPDEHIGSAKCVACEAEDALRANRGGM